MAPREQSRTCILKSPNHGEVGWDILVCNCHPMVGKTCCVDPLELLVGRKKPRGILMKSECCGILFSVETKGLVEKLSGQKYPCMV